MTMKRPSFTGPAAKILAIVAVVGIFVGIIYSNIGLPAPKEANRVTTLNGQLSIIAPPNWEAMINYHPLDKQYLVTIELTPEKYVGKMEKLFAGALRDPPNVEKLKATGFFDYTFQGHPALLWAGRRRKTAEFAWDLIFEQSGSWYEIVLRLGLPDDIPNSDWWPYLNSFRAKPVPAAATLPSTAPFAPVPGAAAQD